MSLELLPRLRVVLVETSHPGNIGAVARAMKTMGLARLALVEPKRFPCAEATAMAAGADDILYDATVHDTLDAALAGTAWVVGASARDRRRVDWPVLEPAPFASEALARAADVEVALVFGREHSGLSNDELDRCHALLRIPTSADYHSLNLAAAVQVAAWELREAALAGATRPDDAGRARESVAVADMEGFYAHLEQVLAEVGYLDRRSPRLLMRRLRRLFNRAQPDRPELNILRGILAATQRARRQG
ncbi:MAG: RNA methyltransferase [Gemmatimonadetes bacterium]|nr:RNA methyltransferase [Gemmatimonadota bacterium]